MKNDSIKHSLCFIRLKGYDYLQRTIGDEYINCPQEINMKIWR